MFTTFNELNKTWSGVFRFEFNNSSYLFFLEEVIKLISKIEIIFDFLISYIFSFPSIFTYYVLHSFILFRFFLLYFVYYIFLFSTLFLATLSFSVLSFYIHPFCQVLITQETLFHPAIFTRLTDFRNYHSKNMNFFRLIRGWYSFTLTSVVSVWA